MNFLCDRELLRGFWYKINSAKLESNFNIVLKKGSSKRVENLTPYLITQSKAILFSEIID